MGKFTSSEREKDWDKDLYWSISVQFRANMLYEYCTYNRRDDRNKTEVWNNNNLRHSGNNISSAVSKESLLCIMQVGSENEKI